MLLIKQLIINFYRNFIIDLNVEQKNNSFRNRRQCE